MNVIRLPLALAAATLLSSQAFAQPDIELVLLDEDTAALNVISDATGSIAVEFAALALEASGDLDLIDARVNSAIFDTANPGDNPFIPGIMIGGDSNGLWTDFPNNRVFASFGTGVIGSGTFEFLQIDFTGEGTLLAFGVTAQLGVLSDPRTASLVIPEPTTAAMLFAALAATGVRRRRV